MKRFGLLGYPISHSVSPAVFGAAYGGAYPYELVETEDWTAAFRAFLDSYDAVQVTMPFKEKAFAAASVRSPECLRIGAANILLKTPEGIAAFNSDCSGVGECLRKAGMKAGQKALVVGCGGAGRAAAVAAADCGLEVLVTDRTLSRAEGFGRLSGLPVLPFEEECSADIMIYCIPVAVENMTRWKAGTILEANYKDPVLRNAACTRYISGLEWHFEQAVAGFRILTGDIAPDTEEMKKLYRF